MDEAATDHGYVCIEDACTSYYGSNTDTLFLCEPYISIYICAGSDEIAAVITGQP